MAKKGDLPPTLIIDLFGEEGMKTAMQLFVSSGIFPENGWQKSREYSYNNYIDEIKMRIYVNFMITPLQKSYRNNIISITIYDHSINPHTCVKTVYGRESIEELIQQYKECINEYIGDTNKKINDLSNKLKWLLGYEKSFTGRQN